MNRTVLAMALGAILATPALADSQPRTLFDSPRHDIEDEVFYFVLPDRFHDGNPDNNQGDPNDPHAFGGHDPADKGMFHGGDIAGLQQKLDYLEGLGITAIWLTPILKNKAVQGDSAGYHGYWTLDFTRLDPHFGSNEEMKAFIAAAHERGIKIFFDIIVNHTADVIKYRECHQENGAYLPGLSRCDYRSRERVAAGEGYTPFIPAGEENAKVPAWLNDPRFYHNQGDSSFSGEDSLYGDFFGLDDLDTGNPEVVAGLIDIFTGLIDEWRPDGFRLDTVKHVDADFWRAFAPAVLNHARDSAGIEHFTMFGEVFSSDPRELSFYTRSAGLPTVLDFGFQAAAGAALAGQGGVSALTALFEQDDRYNHAGGSANQLLNFLGNHDIGRFGHFLQAGGEPDDAKLLARYRLANALLFFSRGVPVIYYGDEQGFTGEGGDKDARQNMFPSRVASYNAGRLIGTTATTADDNFDPSHPLYRDIAGLSALYREHPVLRRGIQLARPNSDDSDRVLTFSRVDLAEGVEYLLAFNLADEALSLTLPAAGHYRPITGEAAPREHQGELQLTLAPLQFAILKAEGIAPSPVAEPVLSGVAPGARTSGLLELEVTAEALAGQALPQYQVRFEASLDGGDFETLAVDNNAPYRLYWDTGALAEGTEVTLRASLSNLVAPPRQAEVSFILDGRSPRLELSYANPHDLPELLLYDEAGGMTLLRDADAATPGFQAAFDWGEAARRTLVFARLDREGGATVLEQPLLLERERVMAASREDDAGGLVATLPLEDESRPLLERVPEPLAAELHFRGGANDWGLSPLAAVAPGTYAGTIRARAGVSEFKFADASWGLLNLGAPLTATGLSAGGNPGNLRYHFAQDGDYQLTLWRARDPDGREYYLPLLEPAAE
ncbi:alpha-amylase family glycosyl hydrolase [Zobellella denitrificans]